MNTKESLYKYGGSSRVRRGNQRYIHIMVGKPNALVLHKPSSESSSGFRRVLMESHQVGDDHGNMCRNGLDAMNIVARKSSLS